MDDDLAPCRQCETAFRAEPGDAGLCGSCREAQYPSIEAARDKKWSPLQLGLFSVVCDVMLIPSVLAIVRAVSELRAVARHEAAGVWRPEHARVRTGAVFGMLAGAARPALLGLVMVAALTSPRAGAREPFGSGNELEEILARIESRDEWERELAVEHLEEVIETLDRAGALVLLRAAGERTDPEARTTLLLSAIAVPGPGGRAAVRFEEVRPLYDRVELDGRTMILALAVQEGTRESVEGMVELLETYPDEQEVRAEALVDVRQPPELYLERLVALPDESSGHWLGLRAAQLLCDRGADRAVFAPIQNALLFEWATARGAMAAPDPHDRFAAAFRAADAARVLGCVDSAAAAAVLESASGLDDSRVATAAVDAMLRRGDRVPTSTIARIAADPVGRWPLFDVLRRHHAIARLPAAARTSRALADAWMAYYRGGAVLWAHAGTEERRFVDLGTMDVHVYDALPGSDAVGRLAIGPFAEDRAPDVTSIAGSPDHDSAARLADQLAAEWRPE